MRKQEKRIFLYCATKMSHESWGNWIYENELVVDFGGL